MNLDGIKQWNEVLHKTHKNTPTQETLNVFAEIDTKLDTICEPYLVKNILPSLIERFNDKNDVSDKALELGLKIIGKVNVQVFQLIFNILNNSFKEEVKWKEKLGALKLLEEYIKRTDHLDRDLLSVSLQLLIPSLSGLLYDTKPAVSELSYTVLLLAMRGITNRDIEPFIQDLSETMKDRTKTDDTIYKLAGVVFVQNVDSSALSVIVPLMLAGFRHTKSVIRRMCGRIVSNMAKLVEDPLDVAPFLSDLIPHIQSSIDTISEPEVREVVTQTYEELLQLQKLVETDLKTRQFRQIDTILKHIPESIDTAQREYVSHIVFSLVHTKTLDKDEYVSELKPYLDDIETIYQQAQESICHTKAVIELEDDAPELCNCDFTLAYGTKILLHNTTMRLFKGKKYGLLGQNDCGKTTLMKAISEGSVDGFPDSNEVRTVFVEADILGELSHLSCVNYILEYPVIKNANITEQMVRDMLLTVGFSEGKSSGAGGDCDDNISSLSGGWRMKLALARAMLQKADILLMDEPTNHLDVKNVKWVESYINSLVDTTVIMVSHDSGLLERCCNYIIQIDKKKLNFFKGNLTEFVKKNPEAQSYFEFKAAKFSFTFPQPCFLDGIKSRGKALIKMDNVSYTYPGNTTPTINDITIRASMASRVACVGVNGAGKSTMIKVLTGILEPTQGTVWKYPNVRLGYIAQHAFHHIESHLDKTPNEYIRWRFEFGDDREGLDKASMRLSDADLNELLKPVEYSYKDDHGVLKKENRVINKCTGQRREVKGKKRVYEYELSWKDKPYSSNTWHSAEELTRFNRLYDKMVKLIDHKISARENMISQPLTSKNVETHLKNIGLEPEYASHHQIKALSGGQKVKVVLGASMWDQPHILILDEPTNYLDRESLGALAEAIEKYEGGVIMITHNDAFCRQLCPERWVLEAGRLNTEGDIEWMNKMSNNAVEFQQITDMVDASGNEVKLTKRKKLNAKEKKKKIKLITQKINDGATLDSEEEEYAIEWNL